LPEHHHKHSDKHSGATVIAITELPFEGGLLMAPIFFALALHCRCLRIFGLNRASSHDRQAAPSNHTGARAFAWCHMLVGAHHA
jgi:hypothetical protein